MMSSEHSNLHKMMSSVATLIIMMSSIALVFTGKVLSTDAWNNDRNFTVKVNKIFKLNVSLLYLFSVETLAV